MSDDNDSEMLEVGSLPNAKLRETIARAGLEYADIIERSELEACARRALSKLRESSDPASGVPPPPEREPSGLYTLTAAQNTRVVHLPKLFSSEEIQSVHDLALAVGDSGRDVGRVHKQLYRQGRGAWDTVYLSVGHRFGAALPALRQKLIDAAWRAEAEAGWNAVAGGFNSCAQILPRCVEYHTVGVHGSLPWVQHQDHGSVYTVDVMLSRPGVDFGGGEFRTLEPTGKLRPHAFGQGDALVFVSHKPHCVAPVEWGRRNVLVVELWQGDERPCAHRCNFRDPRWASCAAA